MPKKPTTRRSGETSSDQVLTNRKGHPITNNQSQRTVGNRGPATLENYQLLEKITHLDRERIPERVVHARGFVCYSEFEATGRIGDEPASKYTRAKLFQEAGKKTPLAIRFSTAWGQWTSSMKNYKASAEEVLSGMHNVLTELVIGQAAE